MTPRGRAKVVRCHPVCVTARFVHQWWQEEGIHFFFELDDDGYITRHIQVDAVGEVTSAASRNEWNRERDYGDLYRYQAQWGEVGGGQVLLDDPPTPPNGTVIDELEPIDEREFEKKWDEARKAREAHWQRFGREEYERTRGARPVWRPLKAEER